MFKTKNNLMTKFSDSRNR